MKDGLVIAWLMDRLTLEVNSFLSKRTVTDLTVCVTMTEAGTVQQWLLRISVPGGTKTHERKPGERKLEQRGSKAAVTGAERQQVKKFFHLFLF